jgi:cell division protein FtsB
MLEFQKKKKIKSFIYSKLVLIFILFVLFIFAKATMDFYQKAEESKNRKQKAENELNELQNRKINLENKLNRINSPTGIEEELRERFDLVKEGEQIILINDNKEGTTSEDQ